MEYTSVVDSAYKKAGEITKSVLMLARVMGVKPSAFAEALADGDANAAYNAEFTAEFLKVSVAKATKEAKDTKNNKPTK